MRIPKSATKAKRELMLTGKIRPTVKPDWDNLGKLVSDALNGIAYDDDKSVVDASVRKYYSDRPRTQITVCDADTE
nr:MAG TPA: Endodeoxyribonuclease RusA [Caudoviricetes sp.]